MYMDYGSLFVQACRILPDMLNTTIQIENGWLVLYLRLEAYQALRPKSDQPHFRLGEDYHPPEMERVTQQRIVVGVRHCADLDAVATATREAAAELERIQTWRKNKAQEPPYGAIVAG